MIMAMRKLLYPTPKKMTNDNQAKQVHEGSKYQISNASSYVKNVKESDKKSDNYGIYGSASLRLSQLRKRLAEGRKSQDGIKYENGPLLDVSAEDNPGMKKRKTCEHENLSSMKAGEHQPRRTVLPSARCRKSVPYDTDYQSAVGRWQGSVLHIPQHSTHNKPKVIEGDIIGSTSSSHTASGGRKCSHVLNSLERECQTEKSNSFLSGVKMGTGNFLRPHRESGMQRIIDCASNERQDGFMKALQTKRHPGPLNADIQQGSKKDFSGSAEDSGTSRRTWRSPGAVEESQGSSRKHGDFHPKNLPRHSLPTYVNCSDQPSQNLLKTQHAFDTHLQGPPKQSCTSKRNDVSVSQTSASRERQSHGLQRHTFVPQRKREQPAEPERDGTAASLLAAQIKEVEKSFSMKHGAQNKVENLLNSIRNKKSKKRKAKGKMEVHKSPLSQTLTVTNSSKKKGKPIPETRTVETAKTPQPVKKGAAVSVAQPNPPSLGECHADEDAESMEWEPIEEKQVLSHIEELRRCPDMAQPGSGELARLCGEPSSSPAAAAAPALATGSWCVVLDTNVLLSNLGFVARLLERPGEPEPPLLLLPWTVVQELDHIKSTDWQPLLQACARRAIRFLHRHLSERHPRLQGQTRADAEKVKEDLPDDRILRCCEQLSESWDHVLLLTNDSNLCSKAIINHLDSCSAIQLQRRLETQKLNRKSPAAPTAPTAPRRSDNSQQQQQQQQQLAQLAVQVKDCLKDLLADILEQEMKSAFENMWERIVARKPPWSLHDVLFCLLKHWVAVFHLVLPAAMQGELEELQKLVGAELGQRASSADTDTVQRWIRRSHSVLHLLPTLTYLEAVNRAKSTLDKLEQQLQKLRPVPSELPLQPPPSRKDTGPGPALAPAPSPGRELGAPCQRSLELVQRCFNFVWEKTAIFCGVLCEAMGVPPCVPYQRPDPFPSADSLHQPLGFFLPFVHALVKRLDEVLAVGCSDLVPTHPALLALHQALQEALPGLGCGEWPAALAPAQLHLYCTQAQTRQQLSCGKQQFEQFEAVLVRAASSHST